MSVEKRKENPREHLIREANECLGMIDFCLAHNWLLFIPDPCLSWILDGYMWWRNRREAYEQRH